MIRTGDYSSLNIGADFIGNKKDRLRKEAPKQSWQTKKSNIPDKFPVFQKKKRNFADGQLALTGWRVDLHYGKGRLLT